MKQNFVTAFIILFSLLFVAVSKAATYIDENGNTLTYSILSGGGVSINGVTLVNPKVIIPSTIGGRSVTRIYCAFKDKNVNAVVLPPTIREVTGLGTTKVFGTCKELYISDMSSWLKIEWEDGQYNNPLEYNRASLYLNNEKVTEVVVPEDIKQIKPYAFGSYYLRRITIGPNVTEISPTAFLNVIKAYWTTNTFPKGYIDVVAKVHYRSNNKDVDGSNILFKYGKSYLYPLLTSMFEVDGGHYVITPEGTSADLIDSNYDSSSTNVIIGTTVTYRGRSFTIRNINAYAYLDNDYVEKIDVSNEGNVETDAFANCENLKSVVFNNAGHVSSACARSTINGEVYVNCGGYCNLCFQVTKGSFSAVVHNSIGSSTFRNSTGLTQITIPSDVSSIGGSCFENCPALTKVIWEEGTTSVGSNAFYGCTSLEDIQIPNSVTELGRESFYGCTALKSAIIGRGITTIKPMTFRKCGLREIFIPQEISSIDSAAFSSLSRFELEEGNTRITLDQYFAESIYHLIVGRRVYHNPKKPGEFPFKSKGLRDVVFTGNEVEIYSDEFWGNSYLSSVKACASIKKLNREAFDLLPSLTNVEIPGVTQIGNRAFYGCSGLSKIDCPEVTVIGDSAFCGCTGLQLITLPDELTEIGTRSFQDCM